MCHPHDTSSTDTAGTITQDEATSLTITHQPNERSHPTIVSTAANTAAATAWSLYQVPKMMEFKNDAILTAAAGAAARPPPPSAAAAAAAVPVKNAADARYSFDDTKLAKLRTDSP